MLSIQGVTKQYGSKILFEKAEVQIGNRSRVALIGPNGSGKSTLIRIILGLESSDAGSVSRANHLAIGHLAQEAPKFSGRSVLAEVMRLDGRREDLIAAKKELEEKFAVDSGQSQEEELERYGRVMEELDHLDEYRLEARAKEILTGMGFKAADWDRSLTEFSGGWLMRVALSRLLLMDPDLLLLDEPTNHLDLETLLWLEEFLRGFRGALLLVSHDTEFLNRMVDQVVEIDQRKLWTYRGNLDAYALQKQERLTVLKAQYQGQQAKIADLEAFISRFGAKATKARQAQSRAKQLEKMERIELPDDRSTVRFRFPPCPHSGREIITMRRASMAYGEKKVLKDLDWTIQRGTRVAIVGVNGAGKTTLLKLLSGQLEPSDGELKFGHEVKVGYYAQHQAESLDFKKTIIQELEQVAPEMPMSQVRAIAGAFLFTGDAVEKKCGVLSGGEKARVALAKLLLSPANFLVLDEPTNHLDVESRGVLLEALQDYDGTLCVVSHDRSFVSPLVDAVLEIEPGPMGSKVNHLLGNYDDYLEKKLKEVRLGMGPSGTHRGERSQEKAGSSATGKIASGGAPSNNQKRSWERMREKLEGEIARLELKSADLHRKLADTSTYSDKSAALKLVEDQRQLDLELAEKLAEWEKVCGLLEGVIST